MSSFRAFMVNIIVKLSIVESLFYAFVTIMYLLYCTVNT